MPFARADGSNDAKRIAQLSVQGFDKIETFDVFFALTRNKPDRPFDVTAHLPNGVTRTLTLSPIDLAARRAQMKTPPGDDVALWSLAFEPGNVARLTMPDWALYDSKWDWKAFIDNAFAEIARRDAPALIVDLRGNEGGLDCGDEILARCARAPIARTAYERRVRYRRIPPDLDPYLDTWDPSFKDWGAAAVPIDGRFFRLLEKDGDSRAPIAPKGALFKGRLIVLVDASNSSATFQFAETVRANRLGTLVGEPTGGNLRGINGGGFFFLRLPASGLEADLPLIGTFPLTPQPDAGIVPDIVVADTPADIAAGRDAVFERALSVARG
jgi:C-terminal processing protease CtpA/Prc